MTGSHSTPDQRARTGVLFLHGLCGSPAEMRFVAHAISRAGYVVHCPTLAGHGAGLADLKQTRWQDWLESAREGLDALSATCDKVIVGGLSTGALLALMLAHRHPEKVQALALYSPTLWLNGHKVPWSMRVARRLLAFRPIARLFDFPAPQNYGIKDERVREFLGAAQARPGSASQTLITPGVSALERRWLASEVLEVVNEIRQPTLILHPREDCLADLDNAFHLQRNLGGRCELLVLDDSYHLVTVDRQRQLVADTTLRFLNALGGARSTGQNSKETQSNPIVSPMALAGSPV